MHSIHGTTLHCPIIGVAVVCSNVSSLKYRKIYPFCHILLCGGASMCLWFFLSSLVGVITFTFCGAVSYRPTARSQPAAALNINALLWFIHAFDGQFSWLRCQPAFRPYACLCCCLGLFLLLSSFFYRIFIEKKLINYEYLCAVRLVTQGDRHTK